MLTHCGSHVRPEIAARPGNNKTGDATRCLQRWLLMEQKHSSITRDLPYWHQRPPSMDSTADNFPLTPI